MTERILIYDGSEIYSCEVTRLKYIRKPYLIILGSRGDGKLLFELEESLKKLKKLNKNNQ